MAFQGRVILIVLDSVGIGEAPDARDYGDQGSNTVGNTARALGGLDLPHLGRCGLGNLTEIVGVPPNPSTIGAYGRMQEQSRGKDSTTGHWEIAGIILDRPFPTYPQGFPPDVIARVEEAIGRRVMGNKVASGTEIIAELGQEHLETGRPIVYTSADSVFQIAAHEDVLRPDQLHALCRRARAVLQGPHGVARVIARPFIGTDGAFVRTAARLDFSLPPPHPTILDHLTEANVHVHAIGKVSDLFAGRGIRSSVPTTDNMMGIDETIHAMESIDGPALIFTNCVDFDVLYGHRNDPHGYGRALMEFDARLPEIIDAMRSDDMLIITADHGCDPTTESTDHSRELVPLLVVGNRVRPGTDLRDRATFADVSATLAEFFSCQPTGVGTSFAADIWKS